MIVKINNMFSSAKFTLISAIFLILSFITSRINLNIIIDPAWVTIIICGFPLLYLSIWRIINNKGISKITSALLITIAMLASIAIGDLFAAGEVAFIMALGAILEDKTTQRAQKGLNKLVSITPVTGRKINSDCLEIIPIECISCDDILRILPGEVIPADGIIVEGHSTIDQSIISGESIPIDKEVADSVYCGTMNCFGVIDIKVTSVGERSSLNKLIKLVEDADKNQSSMERIADKWSTYLVPIALSIAILASIITKDIIRGVTVMVVFCPCALVLATPTAIMAAIGQATKHGVIIKSGEALEKLASVNTFAFDKTGTLTKGQLEISDIFACNEIKMKDDLIVIAASIEENSEHPIGKAIVNYTLDNNLQLKRCINTYASPGYGIQGCIENETILCGNAEYMRKNNVLISTYIRNHLERLQMEGKATLIVAQNGNCIGVIGLSDVIKKDSPRVLGELRNLNVSTLLLTGDNKNAAEYFSNKIKIDHVISELLPEGKYNIIKELQDKGEKICMIGDGINDAPALKMANVGVAMGTMGSDIAVEAADIALMNDDISKIPYLKKLSNGTVNTIKFSIGLSMLINFIAVTLSVVGILTPTTGALVHNGGSCLVVLIATLLYDRKFE